MCNVRKTFHYRWFLVLELTTFYKNTAKVYNAYSTGVLEDGIRNEVTEAARNSTLERTASTCYLQEVNCVPANRRKHV
jgi:hypothetical protein